MKKCIKGAIEGTDENTSYKYTKSKEEWDCAQHDYEYLLRILLYVLLLLY